MITSTANPQVKHVVALQTKARSRQEEDLFVVEGERMVAELPAEQRVRIYASESFMTRPQMREKFAVPELEIVSDAVFAKMAKTKNPQGILALAKQRHDQWEDMRGGPLLILENIQDPGNLGTMIRTGEGAGFGGILANRQTVDRYNPKVVRSTMGSIYRVPYQVVDDLGKTIERLKEEGYTVFAAHLKGEASYTSVRYAKKTVFLIGNEGNGLSDEIAGMANTYIRIPMEGKVESLNAAIAATLLMYEWNRQQQ